VTQRRFPPPWSVERKRAEIERKAEDERKRAEIERKAEEERRRAEIERADAFDGDANDWNAINRAAHPAHGLTSHRHFNVLYDWWTGPVTARL
jgi:hypothetical protein